MNILVVDDDKEYRIIIKKILEKKGYSVSVAESGFEALEIIEKENFPLVLSDLKMPNIDGIEFLSKIKTKNKKIQVILVTGFGTIKNAVEAMKKGAFSYFIKGNPIEELLDEIKKAEEHIKAINKNNTKNSKEVFLLESKNKNFINTMKLIEKVSKEDINVLLLGESGVGKDVIAKSIHKLSKRNNQNLVIVNCCSYSDGLLESELFGHEKGAFTGASSKRIGKFEKANQGTLFLDEVFDIPLDVQVKLLRSIENKTIERAGSNEIIPLDFRLICATNKNPKEEISKGKLREDFFYRISTITVTIPPLRDRKEDLPMLIEFFLNTTQEKYNKNIISIDKKVMDFLLEYNYPGNIRELKNIINRLVVLSEKNIISENDLYLAVNSNNNFSEEVEEEEIKPLKEIRKDFEYEYIEKALNICNNNVSKTAKKLCISRRQLTNKIAEYSIK